MKFCPKCDTRLVLKKIEKKAVLACPRPGCDYQEPASKVEAVVSSENQNQEVLKILEKDVKGLHPTTHTKVVCPKCGHTKAYFWLVQTRGTDESPSQFFRCVRCNNTWREYS
ncbi:MAG: transcription factor S [Thermoproteota archaeon]